ncbi:hypothetical protein [Staphylococcus simulans]|uniref:hypothetical protein n=1 Tax=Staphylococcus simulans TaxID=1286 RepID=UPI0013049E14|nr:hypothetical protein [Staphylococcus simulans]
MLKLHYKITFATEPQNQTKIYDMYRKLAYTRVKDRHELFKDLDTLYNFKKELEDDE